MPKFMLALRGEANPDYSQFSPEDMQKIIQEYDAWAGKLASQGLLLDGEKLTDEGGMVMMPEEDGSVTIKDGPYLETKEVLGGIYLIKANDYAHAAELCQGHPNFRFGSIEIRQIDPMGQDD